MAKLRVRLIADVELDTKRWGIDSMSDAEHVATTLIIRAFNDDNYDDPLCTPDVQLNWEFPK